MSLKDRVLDGVLWVGASSLVSQGIGIASSIILARLLSPGDFGLLEITLVLVTLSSVLTEFGLGQALVQWDGSDVHIAADTSLIICISLSAILCALLIFLAPLIASFYQLQEATGVIRAMSFSVFLGGVGIVPSSLLERKLDFRRKTLSEIVPRVCYGIVAIGLALLGMGVWSLVIGQLSGGLLQSLFVWACSDFRPSCRLAKPVARRLLRFGGPLVFMSLLLLATRKMDIAYLGRRTNVTEVGFYGLAMTISNLTVDLTASLLGRVTFPAFARLQGDFDKLAQAYLKATRFISYAALPAILGGVAVAPAAIIAVYGAKWARVALLFRILAIYAISRSLSRLSGSIFTATGHPGTTTRIVVLRLILFATLLLLLGAAWGTSGAAWAASLSMLAAGVWSIWLTNRHLGVAHRSFLAAIGPQMIAAGIMCVLISFLGRISMMPWMLSVIQVACGIILYVIFLFALASETVRADLQEIWELMRQRVPKVLPRH